MRGLGYRKDVRDPRDRLFAAHRAAAGAVPERSDVDLWNVAAKDQGMTSSCVGNAGSAGLRRAFAAVGQDPGELAARFAYRGALNVDGSNVDEGTYLASVAKFMQGCGCASEEAMPFSESQITDPIPFSALRDAFDRRRLGSYHRIADGDVDAVCRALAAGLPVIAGWDVAEAFVSGDGRTVVDVQRAPIAGGHALCIVGHDSSANYEERVPAFSPSRSYSRLFRVLNSWGPGFGYAGRFFATPEFVASASDLWALDVSEVTRA